jgi:hypothetical protein
MFTQALTIIPHLSPNGLSGMVYEHLLRCLILKDPSLGLSRLFQVVVIHGDNRLVALVLGANKLLAMAKKTSGFSLIAVSKMFFQLMNCSIVLQLQGPFQEHLSPHQLSINPLRL